MNILLVEPNYKNKYPPMGLMKISTYHKNRGDKVVFYKGIMPKEQFEDYKFDRVYITSLFTFYYGITLKTIKAYQKLISSYQIYVGGIMASLMTKKLTQDIDNEITVLTGLLTDTISIGFDDKINIDTLPLDYYLIDDITYKYPAGNNYFAYTSRGCTNKCKFCAVPKLEPKFKLTNNLINQINTIKEQYGEKQNLLLLDNNILSFDLNTLSEVVDDIVELGFDKTTKFFSPLPLTEFLKELECLPSESPAHENVLAELIKYLDEKAKIKKSKVYEDKYKEIFAEIKKSDNPYNIILKNKDILTEILAHYHRPAGRRRCVDFNQGMDARQLNEDNMRILSRIPIEPFRLAFDSIKYTEIYSNALRLAVKFGVKSFSNYILYNYEDHPEELRERLKINIELAKELDVQIFSFPMKYAPIDRTDRKFIGMHWNKQYLSNIYAILNVTKGIVAAGESFFNKAFGASVDEYFEILSMPRDFVTYRGYFEKNGLTEKWQNQYKNLSELERKELISVLSMEATPKTEAVQAILPYYQIKYQEE
ncbi:MAG: hypothetical protein AB9836_07120 [Aminipila sp.]